MQICNEAGAKIIMKRLMLAVLGVFLSACGNAAAQQNVKLVCPPSSFGGAPDDAEPDTIAIQAAIDACRQRGGVVILSPGVWLTGGLRLGSDMTFRLEEGAVLKLIPDIALYPQTNAPGSSAARYAALYAPSVYGLKIEGPGRINGSGPSFWDENFYELGIPRPTLPRPAPVIDLVDCSNIRIADLMMENTPGYGISFQRCDGGVVQDIKIRNDLRSPNTDGIQIRGSKNITIRRADIETGDDAIVLKSNQGVVENIVVEDSILVSDDGAIKFGTGSRYGVKNSTFKNNKILRSRYGIAIFAIDGGVHANNVFENLEIETGGRHRRTYPVFVDVDRRKADRDWGGVDGLVFRNINITTGGASMIAGNPNGLIRNLILDNVSIERTPHIEDLGRSGRKPRGNVLIEAQAGSLDYAREKADIVIAHARNVILSGMSFPECRPDISREYIKMIDVKTVSGDWTQGDSNCSP